MEKNILESLHCLPKKNSIILTQDNCSPEIRDTLQGTINDCELTGEYVQTNTPGPMENSQFFITHPSAYAVFKELVGDKERWGSTIDWDFIAMSAISESSILDSSVGAEGVIFNVDKDFEKGPGSIGSIILVAPGNKIWAAIANIQGTGHFHTVSYYTNVPGWEQKFPNTIKDWKWVKTADYIDYSNFEEKQP